MRAIRRIADIVLHLIYRLRFGRFEHLGRGVRIALSAQIECPGRISIGDWSQISAHCFVRATPGGHIRIGKGCFIGPFTTLLDAGGFVEMEDRASLGGSNFVTGQGGLKIGEAALIAPMVSIVANQHTFEDPDTPVRDQPELAKGITIGRNGWIGVGAAVLDGVTVGEHVVIGANSVVTRDLPSFCVAVGAPARVIRQIK
ncbi:MAG: acyltransferase [Armatimonadota bacterium]